MSDKCTLQCPMPQTDDYGNTVDLTTKMPDIIVALDKYICVPYGVVELRQSNVNDPHGRIDLSAEYTPVGKRKVRQKFLVMNGELIDGDTFHKRYHEWYD